MVAKSAKLGIIRTRSDLMSAHFAIVRGGLSGHENISLNRNYLFTFLFHDARS